MDSSEVTRIVGSDTTVSNKIRALDAAGYPRSEIARLLGKRYQHVRNVLEADKLHGRPALAPPPAEDAPGVQETSTPFRGGVVRLEIRSDGSVQLPPAVMEALGLYPGAVAISRLEPDRLVILSNAAAWENARKAFKALNIDPTRDLVAELVAERRGEAAREDAGD